MQMYFKNKVIWITGASSGIGAELAKQLAKKSTKLILTARRKEALEDVVSECKPYTQNCQILPADLSQSDTWQRITEEAIRIYGHIDIVIHSAGLSQRSTAKDTSMDTIRKIMEVNYFATVAISKFLLPHFIERGNGHIVPISSMAGLMGFPMRTGYVASKHAVKGFFETMQTEMDIPNLNITVVSPGRINTPISLSAITASGELHGKMDKDLLNGIPVNECAAKILSAVEMKKKHVIVARSERYLWWFWWFIPSAYRLIANKKGMHNSKY